MAYHGGSMGSMVSMSKGRVEGFNEFSSFYLSVLQNARLTKR